MKQKSSPPSNTELLSRIKSTKVFENLDDSILECLSNDLECVLLSEGEILCRQGEPSDALYINIEGYLRATITRDDLTEVIVGEIGPGDLVGEMQILFGGNRTSNVHASCQTQLVKLPMTALQKLEAEDPLSTRKITEIIRQRFQHNQLAIVLNELFGSLDETMIQEIEAHVEWCHLRGNEILFRQGDSGDSFYIVPERKLSFSPISVSDQNFNPPLP